MKLTFPYITVHKYGSRIPTMDTVPQRYYDNEFFIIWYVDDIAILLTSKFLCELLQVALRLSKDACCEKRLLSVNPSRTELIFFRHRYNNLKFNHISLHRWNKIIYWNRCQRFLRRPTPMYEQTIRTVYTENIQYVGVFTHM